LASASASPQHRNNTATSLSQAQCVRERSSGGLETLARLYPTGSANRPQPPDADRALVPQRPCLPPARPFASHPKGEVMERLREFLNDEVW
jgi:hypothetical protein